MGWLARVFGGKQVEAPLPTSPVEAFHGLRSLALQIGENPPGYDGLPRAVLMESAYSGGVIATLAGYCDGTTSLYFSNGGGILGAGGHVPVTAATSAWLRQATEFAPSMTPTDDFPLPETGRVRFYVVLADRILTAEAGEDDLGNKRHSLSPLFHGAHAVITQVRLHSPR